MKVLMEDINDFRLDGVEIRCLDGEKAIQDKNFSWFPARKEIQLNSADVMLGMLEAKKDKVCFSAVEYHDDTEIFCYLSGSPVICFCGIVSGRPDMGTVHIVKVPQNTIVKIGKYIGHCVPVADDNNTIKALVVSSKAMQTFNANLDEEVIGEY